MSPNDGYKITDKDKIKEINEKKNKLFDKINSKRTYLSSKDNCLLNPKFIKLGKMTLIANFVKKGKIEHKILVQIVKNASFGYYYIIICKDYSNNDIKLKNGQEYIADVKLLKKINSKAWKAIVDN